jgi:hypothetical protein
MYNKNLNKMNKETLRMQMLAGIITEGQYKAKLNENIKYTEDEASKLFDYHERTGMLPQDMTSEEYDEIMSYYNIKRNNDDTDPAGGSGIHSHV